MIAMAAGSEATMERAPEHDAREPEDPVDGSTSRLRALVPELAAATFVAAASLVVSVLTLGLWRSDDLRIPFWTTGDAPPLMAMIKGLDENGWYLTNPQLGAPEGQHLHDFPVYGADLLHFLTFKAFTVFADSAGLMLNVFIVASFPLTALSAYAAMRWLGLSRQAAAVPAVLFSLIPFHFLRIRAGHDLLASYVAVPIGVYLAASIMAGRALLQGRRRTAGTVALCALVGTTGIYFAAFTLFLLVFATAVSLLRPDDRGVTLRSGAIAVGAILVVLVAGLAPTLLLPARERAERGRRRAGHPRYRGLRPDARVAGPPARLPPRRRGRGTPPRLHARVLRPLGGHDVAGYGRPGRAGAARARRTQPPRRRPAARATRRPPHRRWRHARGRSLRVGNGRRRIGPRGGAGHHAAARLEPHLRVPRVSRALRRRRRPRPSPPPDAGPARAP